MNSVPRKVSLRMVSVRWLHHNSGPTQHPPVKSTTTTEQQDVAAIPNWPHRIALDNPAIPSFRGLGLREKLCSALDKVGITAPTPVQRASIQQILRGEDVIIRSQTGSGKTLAILLSVLHNMKSSPKSTQTLIVVPTRELGLQIVKWIVQLKQLNADHTKFVFLAVAGVNLVHHTAQLKQSPPPIVVGTPGVLIELMEHSVLDYKHVKTLVIDEVDHIIQPLSGYASSKQVKNRERHPRSGVVLIDEIKKVGGDKHHTIVASATVNHNTRYELHRRKWMRQYGTVLVHVGAPFSPPGTLKHHQIMVKENSEADMDAALQQAFNALKPHTGLVFIESSASVTRVVERMKVMGLPAESLSGTMDFNSPSYTTPSTIIENKGKPPSLLVATEFTARGLDLPNVQAVFILGMFFTPNSYLHMAGRTARMGNKGDVVLIFHEHNLPKATTSFKLLDLVVNPLPSLSNPQ